MYSKDLMVEVKNGVYDKVLTEMYGEAALPRQQEGY